MPASRRLKPETDSSLEAPDVCIVDAGSQGDIPGMAQLYRRFGKRPSPTVGGSRRGGETWRLDRISSTARPGSVKLVRRSLRLLKRNKPSEGFFGNNLDYAVVPDFEQRSQHHSRVGNVSGELRAHCGLSALVAEPQQMCSCPLSPTSLGRRWNLWAGSASRPANSLPSPLPQARAGTLWAMGSALDHTHEERRCKA